MDLNNLKDHIKDIELDFDQNEVWDNIKKEQSKVKRRLLFWLFSVLGVLVLVFGLFYLDGTDNANLSQGVTNSAESTLLVDSDSNSISKVITDKILPDDGNGHEDKTIATVINETNQNQEETVINSIITSNTNTENTKASNQIVTTHTNRSTNVNHLQSDDIINNIDESPFNTNSLSTVSHRTLVVINNNSINNKTSNNVQNTSIESKNLESDLKGSIRNPNIAFEDIAPSQYRGKIFVSKLNPNIISTPIVYEYTLEKNIKQVLAYTYDHIEPFRKSNSSAINLEAIVEYGMLNRDLSIVANVKSSLVLDQRKKTETSMDHLITGVKLSLPIGGVLYISSGLEYHRLGEKLEFNESSIRPLNQDDLPIGAVSAKGFVISKTSNAYYNQMDLINIPLGIGAKWSQHKFSEFVSAEMSVNLKTTGRQLYLNEFQELTDNAKNVRMKFNNSYVLKAGLAYNISPKVAWSFYASYRYMPNVSTIDSEFDQSYQSYMLGTGIGYKF